MGLFNRFNFRKNIDSFEYVNQREETSLKHQSGYKIIQSEHNLGLIKVGEYFDKFLAGKPSVAQPSDGKFEKI